MPQSSDLENAVVGSLRSTPKSRESDQKSGDTASFTVEQNPREAEKRQESGAPEESSSAVRRARSEKRRDAPKRNKQAAEPVPPPTAPSATQSVDQSPADARPLPPEPNWVRFDDELELLCRLAAQVGGSQPAPISYTALIIAFLWVDASVSVSDWFRGFISTRPSIDVDAIFRSKGVSEESRLKYLDAAKSGTLPAVDPLYSRSTRNLLDQAARIARDVTREEPAQIILGARHLMAAYAFRNPSDHVDQVRGWGFDVEQWRKEFQTFIARRSNNDEDWERLGRPPTSSPPIIGSFTADDPLAPPRDLLGIEDEAAAFARLVAAESVKPPLAIGVFGEWGSGKTFFMRRIYDNVKALSDDANRREDGGADRGPFLPDIVQIRFNAWHYIETNLWASLVEYIFTELDRWLHDKTRSSKSDAEQIFNRLATAQQLKLDALDGLISRRVERRGAELRAERARREYEEAQIRAAGVGAGTYARALMDTLLLRKDVNQSVDQIGDALAAPELSASSGRVLEVLGQARSEAGRAQLVKRAGVARLGTWPWIASVVVVLVGVPLLAVGLRNAVVELLNWPWLKNVHDTALAVSGLLAGAAAWGGVLLRQASGALKQIDEFDKRLRELADEEIEAAKAGPEAARKAAAEEDVRKRKQALEAAERALAEAEARLNEARSDFEAASARSRLNAFIRAKALDGDYAKHLGIIAAIRRDFGQLAALMGAANDGPEQRVESDRLASEGRSGVVRFLDRLASEPEVQLTVGELRSLLTLLEPSQALTLLQERKEQFLQLLESADALAQIEAELSASKDVALPTLSRIILYIDDLDRCPPNVVVDVLQAVHLLLCFPLFTVVVAVDARWVSRALHEQFPKLLGETGLFTSGEPRIGAGATSHDYLEKIFQIPYWVRPVDPDGAQRYVRTLVELDVRRVALTSEFAALRRRLAANAADTGSPDRPSPPNKVEGGDRQLPPLATTGRGSPPPPPTAAALGLELTRWEADALERFAQLISPTPRRLIRFVNLYRLLKTGLAGDARQRLVGEHGESDVYRALIVQLAIVTGAPNAAPAYFRRLAEMQGTDALNAVRDRLVQDVEFKDGRDAEVVLRVLESAWDWTGTALNVEHLRVTASTARRYSFTAWGA